MSLCHWQFAPTTLPRHSRAKHEAPYMRLKFVGLIGTCACGFVVKYYLYLNEWEALGYIDYQPERTRNLPEWLKL
ncbi:MAG: hypothetical protein AB7F86_17595 [Bdellovibrionales bacterium]